MLRQGTWKYVYHNCMDDHHGPERELCDLAVDPGGFESRAGHPAHASRAATMHTVMLRELGENPKETELRCRHDLARGYEA